jgi:hypothetical protein
MGKPRKKCIHEQALRIANTEWNPGGHGRLPRLIDRVQKGTIGDDCPRARRKKCRLCRSVIYAVKVYGLPNRWEDFVDRILHAQNFTSYRCPHSK